MNLKRMEGLMFFSGTLLGKCQIREDWQGNGWINPPMCQRSCRLNISEDNHAPLFTGT